jgi:hypothetical protein
VLETFDDGVIDVGRRQLRLHIDGNPIVRRVVDDSYLVMRALPCADADFNRLSLQDAIRAKRHDVLQSDEDADVEQRPSATLPVSAAPLQ